MKLYVNASDVAACVGMHRFRKKEEMVELYVAKLQKRGRKHKLRNTYDGLCRDDLAAICYAANVPFDEQKPHEAAACAVRTLVSPAVSSISSGEANSKLGSVEQKVSAAFKFCDGTTGHAGAELAVRVCREETRKTRGTKWEEASTNAYENSTQQCVQERNEKKYYLSVGGSSCILVGKIDGLTIDKETGERVLVETKFRSRRLFYQIPLYEKIQMEVYMRMVDCFQAQLNQCLDKQIKILDYQRNNQLWSNVTNGLGVFTEEVQRRSNLLKTLN